MIYSEDINKICALCRYSQPTDDEEKLICSLNNKTVGKSDPDCGKFIYDIFKRPVRRKRKLKTDFNPDDFKL